MEIKSLNKAKVFKGSTDIGSLLRTSNGAVFEYSTTDKAAGSVAFRMPRSRQRFEVTGTNLHPFFAGLLPEGLRLKALKKVLKTSEDDLFSLLIGSGGDVIGDISVSDSEQAPHLGDPTTYELASISFKELFQRSISSIDPRERASDLTVAGVQPKISAGMISFPVQVKMRRKFCILKLSSEEFPRIAENEFFFMTMAKDCGVNVPSCSLVTDKLGVTGLLVERFDRRINKANKKIEKLHQEDACQFLDRYPADKYRLSFREIAEGVASLSSAPIIEVAHLLRLKAFSYLITNGDLHAKNVSLSSLDDQLSIVRLSPAYDLLATLPYGDRTMALSFEGRDDNLTAKDFVNFGARFGVRKAAVERILNEILTQSSAWLPRLGEIGLSTAQENDLRRIMLKRLEQLRPQ